MRTASRLEDLLATLEPGAPVHLHFDCDVITSAEVPAQSYPVTGGPGAAEVEGFLAALATRTSIVAVSVCAWDPRARSGRRVREALPALHRCGVRTKGCAGAQA